MTPGAKIGQATPKRKELTSKQNKGARRSKVRRNLTRSEDYIKPISDRGNQRENTNDKKDNKEGERQNNGKKETDTSKNNQDENDIYGSAFGDNMKNKKDGTIRIATLNVRSFPVQHKDASKYDLLKHEMIKNNYDYIGLTESNHNWRNIKEQEQVHTQTREWWRNTKIQKSWLKTMDKETWQQGGTISIATNNITSHIEGSGEDERKLGR